MKHVRQYSLAIVALAMGMPSSLQAEEVRTGEKDHRDIITRVTDLGKWEAVVEAGVGFGPKYEGSDESEFGFEPGVELIWDDTVFIGLDSVGARLYEDHGFSVSGSLGYGGGREESSHARFRGLGDVDSGIQLGLNLDYELGPVSPYVGVVKDFGGTDGIQVQLGVQSEVPVALLTGHLTSYELERLDDPLEIGPTLSFGLSTDWADGNHMGDYFGVTRAQSARSGLRFHDAGAGFKSVNANLGLTYPITESWSANANVGYSHLIGDAADSPIVKQEGQVFGGLSVSYRF